tara:strand:+ start:220 stop:648 length:429 start_codon:yes stop_codon:yes gene_type:complete
MAFTLAAAGLVTHIAVVPIIQNIYPIIRSIKSSLHSKEVIDIIDEKDIEATLPVMEELFNEITSKKNSKTVCLALKNLEDTLKDVHNLLDIINKKTIDHSNKYFSSWRALDISIEIKELEKKFNLLEKRFKLLHEILTLYNK